MGVLILITHIYANIYCNVIDRETVYNEPVTNISLRYEGESISNEPNLFPVEIHLFFFDVTVL